MNHAQVLDKELVYNFSALKIKVRQRQGVPKCGYVEI